MQDAAAIAALALAVALVSGLIVAALCGPRIDDR